MLPAPLLTLRQPATPAFLARRLATLKWLQAPRRPRTCLAELCRAELAWSTTEWRSIAGDAGTDDWGSHPSEPWRLPHEHAAARLLSCHIQVDLATWSIARLLPALRSQRRAALDASQDVDYRARWSDLATASAQDLAALLARRRLAWRYFLLAAREYVHLRSSLDSRSLALFPGTGSDWMTVFPIVEVRQVRRRRHERTPVRRQSSGIARAGEQDVRYARKR